MQLRDYVHVMDIARANWMSMDLARTDISGEIFNIGFGIGRSVIELDRIIRDYTGSDLEPSFGPSLQEEILKIALDSSKAKKILGWEPEVKFENGLKDLVEYHSTKLACN
jgi:UDP-glucose 4-epimerase